MPRRATVRAKSAYCQTRHEKSGLVQRGSRSRSRKIAASALSPTRHDGQEESRSRCGFGPRLAAPHLCKGFLVIRFAAKTLEGGIRLYLIGVVEAFLHGLLQGS